MRQAQPTGLFTVPPHPPVFYAHKISNNEKDIEIDGDILGKPIWESVPWSAPFSEIRGSHDENHGDPKFVPPIESTPSFHHCRTRMKMLWDDDFLYVAALLEYGIPFNEFGDLEEEIITEKRVSEIIATYTERNSPIYHQDSDFEVFIDPSDSCHDYKELEMNALNTVWNLMLDKPYDVGGQEHSARKDISYGPSDDRYYEVQNQTSAAKAISGKINEKSGRRKYLAWAVEIKMAHSDTLKRIKPLPSFPDSYKPQNTKYWRINFSHVELKGDINWVWSPQLSWDTNAKEWRGFVAMHRPEAWGYVYFVDAERDISISENEMHPGKKSSYYWRDPLWEIRSVAVMIYYELRNYKAEHAKYVDDLSELGVKNRLKNFASLDIKIEIVKHVEDNGFLVTVMDENIGMVSITEQEKMSSIPYKETNRLGKD